jgi:hypothetical protein
VPKKLILFVLFLVGPVVIHAQVVPAARGGTGSIFAGGTFSVIKPDYGVNWLMGIGGYFDVNLDNTFAAEGEVRLMRINQHIDVHEDTYMAGPKFTYRRGKFEPYGKALFGVGEFNFPYSYAHGGYFAMALGGGLDYRITPRLKIRAIDYEYQIWPGYLNSGLTPHGFSFGAAYRVFK